MESNGVSTLTKPLKGLVIAISVLLAIATFFIGEGANNQTVCDGYEGFWLYVTDQNETGGLIESNHASIFGPIVSVLADGFADFGGRGWKFRRLATALIASVAIGVLTLSLLMIISFEKSSSTSLAGTLYFLVCCLIAIFFNPFFVGILTKFTPHVIVLLLLSGQIFFTLKLFTSRSRLIVLHWAAFCVVSLALTYSHHMGWMVGLALALS